MKLQSQNPQGPRSLPSSKPTQPPTPPTPPPTQDTPDTEKLRDQLLESIVSNPEFTKEAMRRVGRGDKVSINVDGRPLVSITSEGPTIAEKVIGGFRSGVRSMTEEVSTVVDNDPAFMLRNAATVVKTQVYNGIPSDLQQIADKAFIPFVRGAALALDSARTIKTFKNPDASWLDKGMDGAHVACDVVGLVGAVAPMIFPPLAPYADKLLAVGFAGDIVSYSYRGLQYFNRRSAGDSGMPPQK
ncbi:MAG: hypothetical protein J0I12_34255 [Candidatus Eremiobacteraeota bacterium]|nr:hypothetical protein [Candidatus Eremiobacteraeota bacterium]